MERELGHPLRDGLSSQAMEPQASPPKALIPDAWQPIEAAPRDGTWFEAANDSYQGYATYQICYELDECLYWVDGKFVKKPNPKFGQVNSEGFVFWPNYDYKGFPLMGDCSDSSEVATHWRPASKAPTDAKV